MTAPAKQSQPWVAIYHGQQCVGHVICRGPRGYEAFDVDDHSLGLFATQADAINALDHGLAS